jgi:carbamoyl-phosphate synthase large subunit
MSAKIKSLTIAVTGVGAIIGQGIMRSLRAFSPDIHIVGIDRNPHSFGAHLCDSFEVKPAVAEDSKVYLEYWKDIVYKHQIVLIMPGLELDTHFLNEQREFFENLGTVLALNASELIVQTRDKWAFGESLATIDYPTIPTVRPDTWAEAVTALGSPPLLLKPLNSNGSRGIQVLEDSSDFNYWRIKTKTPWMLQRIVGNDDQEYTVGIFGFGEGGYIGPIIFRRWLSSAGNTSEVEIVNNNIIEEAVEKLCKFFKPIGPTNLQFRLDGDIPYLLEINPRFSSSNSLRTAFGFNEAEMSIKFFLYRETPEMPTLRQGIAWRYSEDWVKYAGNYF